VPGEIIQVALNANSGDEGPTYDVKIEYAYTVMGTEYRGNRLAFG
jgi:hypothetical protein